MNFAYFQASNEGELISRKDVGKRVIVGRVGSGTLMYVGPIEGKAGIFCGIELDHPEGKHDGTYQGSQTDLLLHSNKF
ncbi:unnamed protein product [Onchocerca flexuosa]|uniref:CAP-Gly domain-containing protein n=1 Tax=Onchocerca flexuosa TaxID=387005 RepID=A0A183HT87_9BILA|nr:unnamed protein product [Onchocerca flexuosa]